MIRLIWEPIKSYFAPLARKKELILLLAVGLSLMTVIDALTVQKLQREQIHHQTLLAQRVQAQLQSALEEHITAMTALNVVYQNFVDISLYDFQQYGQSITSNLKGFRRLMFVDPKLVVRRVYPLTPENTQLFGRPMQTGDDMTELFHRAQTAQRPVTSNLLSFMGDTGGILSVMPIYRSNKEFIGYAVAEISIKDIWEPFSQGDFHNKYQMQLTDPAGHALFPETKLKKRDPFLIKLPFPVTGRTWVLWLQPTQPAFDLLIMQRITLWAVGLFIFLLIYRLITGSKRYKLNLSEAQRQFETIFQASPDGLLKLDDRLQIQLSNPPIQAWSGLTEQVLDEKTFFDLFTCQCPHLSKCRELSFLLCTSEQFDGELPDTLETQVTNPDDGVTRTLRLNASQIRQNDSGGSKNNGFICVLGDISTGKELERIRESYVATLTHDLKTPLIAQELVIERILSGKAGAISEDQVKLLSGARDSVKDLLDMINATLLYYKLESSTVILHKESLPLDPLIREVMETFRPLADKRDLSFAMEKPVDVPNVWMDPLQMKRVFHNLLSNAINHAPKGSIIRLRLETESEDRLRVAIINNGKGIPAGDLPKIFEKYYTLSRRFKQIGTGLGLYVCRRIVELHGGKIWAESDPDKETCFFISLPCPVSV
jgi:PAS domain S-box-containing protein